MVYEGELNTNKYISTFMNNTKKISVILKTKIFRRSLKTKKTEKNLKKFEKVFLIRV